MFWVLFWHLLKWSGLLRAQHYPSQPLEQINGIKYAQYLFLSNVSYKYCSDSVFMSSTGTYLETNKSYPWDQKQRYYRKNILVYVSVCFPTYCPVGRKVNCYLLAQTVARFPIHPAGLRQYYHLHQLRYLSKGFCKKKYSNGFIKAWKHKCAFIYEEETNYCSINASFKVICKTRGHVL